MGSVDKERVREVLRSKVDPYLAFEGGGVELVDVEGDRVKIRLSGSCASCPVRQFTIKQFIERVLKREVPEVKSVETVEE